MDGSRAMKAFCVVRFVEDKSVAVLPSRWLVGSLKRDTAGQLPATAGQTPSPDIITQCLPVLTHDELETFEARLKDPVYRGKVVDALSYLGSDELKKKVTAIMRRLISNEVGSSYSCFGAKGKKSFTGLQMYGVVTDAVRRSKSNSAASEKEIQECIRGWLKNCTTRIMLTKKVGSENVPLRELQPRTMV